MGREELLRATTTSYDFSVKVVNNAHALLEHSRNSKSRIQSGVKDVRKMCEADVEALKQLEVFQRSALALAEAAEAELKREDEGYSKLRATLDALEATQLPAWLPGSLESTDVGNSLLDFVDVDEIENLRASAKTMAEDAQRQVHAVREAAGALTERQITVKNQDMLRALCAAPENYSSWEGKGYAELLNDWESRVASEVEEQSAIVKILSRGSLGLAGLYDYLLDSSTHNEPPGDQLVGPVRDFLAHDFNKSPNTLKCSTSQSQLQQESIDKKKEDLHVKKSSPEKYEQDKVEQREANHKVENNHSEQEREHRVESNTTADDDQTGSEMPSIDDDTESNDAATGGGDLDEEPEAAEAIITDADMLKYVRDCEAHMKRGLKRMALSVDRVKSITTALTSARKQYPDKAHSLVEQALKAAKEIESQAGDLRTICMDAQREVDVASAEFLKLDSFYHNFQEAQSQAEKELRRRWESLAKVEELAREHQAKLNELLEAELAARARFDEKYGVYLPDGFCSALKPKAEPTSFQYVIVNADDAHNLHDCTQHLSDLQAASFSAVTENGTHLPNGDSPTLS